MTWQRKKLHELAELITKGTTPTTLGRQFSDSGVPFLKVENIQNGRILLDSNILHIDAATDALLSRSRIHENDVLLSIAGTIGKTALVPQNAPKLNCNQAIAIIRLRNSVSPQFILQWLRSQDAQKQIHEGKVTATISNLSLTRIRDLDVPLPPDEEQHLIVKILDRIDGMRQKRDRSRQILAQLPLSLFDHCFGGQTSSIQRQPLRNLVSVISGATPAKTQSTFWNGTIPWVSPKDMKPNRIMDSEDHITERALEETNIKVIPANAVLIVVRGMILAHTVPIRNNVVSVTINQDLKALIPIEEVNPVFLRWALQARHSEILSKVSTASHGTKRLETDLLLNFEIPTPSLALQEDFVKQISIVERLHLKLNDDEQVMKTISTSAQNHLFGTLLQTQQAMLSHV